MYSRLWNEWNYSLCPNFTITETNSVSPGWRRWVSRRQETNYVIRIVHHYQDRDVFENNNEKNKMPENGDSCWGQNKNNPNVWYTLWRIQQVSSQTLKMIVSLKVYKTQFIFCKILKQFQFLASSKKNKQHYILCALKFTRSVWVELRFENPNLTLTPAKFNAKLHKN